MRYIYCVIYLFTLFFNKIKKNKRVKVFTKFRYTFDNRNHPDWDLYFNNKKSFGTYNTIYVEYRIIK